MTLVLARLLLGQQPRPPVVGNRTRHRARPAESRIHSTASITFGTTRMRNPEPLAGLNDPENRFLRAGLRQVYHGIEQSCGRGGPIRGRCRAIPGANEA